MNRRTRLGLVRVSLLLSGAVLAAQDLASEIVVSFPPETIQVEFSRPAKLRELSAYSSLRERYMSPRLAALEASLVQLGILESDIDQIVFGWQRIKKETPQNGDAVPPDADPRADRTTKGNLSPTLLDGLASGHFDLDAIARNARAAHVPAAALHDGLNGYCLPADAGTCVVFLSANLDAFGSRETLRQILDARSGRGANLASSQRLLKLLYDLPTQAGVWGIAVGHGAIADCFQGWMPGAQDGGQDGKMDWSRPFESVEALGYSVEAGEKVRLTVNLDCTTFEAATTLAQLFRGLRLLQQLGWLQQNPLRVNRAEALGVETNGSRVSLKLPAAAGKSKISPGPGRLFDRREQMRARCGVPKFLPAAFILLLAALPGSGQ